MLLPEANYLKSEKKNHYKTTHTGQNYFIDIEEVQ